MRLAHLSDPHITVRADGSETAPPATGFLQRAVAHLMQLPDLPDAVIITGDCTHNGTAEEYRHFRALLEPLTMPVYVIPGNHDQRAAMQQAIGLQGAQALEGLIQYAADIGPVRLIALDTHLPGSDNGALSAEQLTWLETRLAEAPTRPTVIAMHHPPFRTGLAVPDQIGLHESEAFGAVISRAPQVERILAGHLHIMMTQRFHGTIAITCAATDANLLPDQHDPQRFVVRREPPLCLLHEWQAETGMITQTSIIGEHGPLIELHDGQGWV